MLWQKRARRGVAIFGVAFAVVVFFAVRDRERPAPAPPPHRLDPKAIIETSGCVLQRVTGMRQDFTVSCDRQLAYENGDAKLFGVRIEVKDRNGRDFAITGAEALANEKTRQINLTGDVKLSSSDGFELTTAAASFVETEGIVRAPGPIAFKKGAMSGTGVGMTYDKNTDVLTVTDQAQVRMVDAAGAPTGEFTAGTATLARVQDYLALERAVHAVRGEQTIDADKGTARLTANEEALTAIELRGNSKVTGGSTAFDSMNARDIDIDYADDGETIERVVLTGEGAVALKGKDGAVGRQILGDSLTLTLAADGAVTSAVARERARLDLPAENGSAARHVAAKNLDATGEPGKGMTSAQFTEDVEYREEGAKAARVARAQRLSVKLDGNTVHDAVFNDRVEFEEGTLKAAAAEARYDPKGGVLKLKGADERGRPTVADAQIRIEGESIDVTLEGRKMAAAGNVKTRVQTGAKTPGLLAKDRPAQITATELRYDGDASRAVYNGTAQLLQGDTSIRGDTITLDQDKGNLSAVGSARSTLVLGEAPSIGRAQEITYDNATREIAYIGIKPPVVLTKPSPQPQKPLRKPVPVPTPVPAVPLPLASPAHLTGPEGDLKADRIVVLLQKDQNELDRLEGYDNVTLQLNQRVVTGGRLTYHNDGRYEMSSGAGLPVKIVEGCRETTGRTLTFFKSTDNIIIDGNEEIRTRTTSGGPCPQLP